MDETVRNIQVVKPGEQLRVVQAPQVGRRTGHVSVVDRRIATVIVNGKRIGGLRSGFAWFNSSPRR